MAPGRSTYAVALAAAALLIGTTQSHIVMPSQAELVVKRSQNSVTDIMNNACKISGGWYSYMSEAITPLTDFAPSTGVLKAAMIFVDFPDAPATDTTKSLYDLYMPSAADWYNTSSFGRLKLDVKADTSRFYRMAKPSTSYKWTREITWQIQEQYIKDAINAVGTAARFPSMDLLYIVPTKAAKAISFSPTYMGPMRMKDGTTMGKTVTFGQDALTWGYKVLNHETGHTIGLPDLYPSDGRGLPVTHYVGEWDLMGLISGVSPDFFAWHKWKLSWIDDKQVACVTAKGTSKHTIAPLEIPGGIKAAMVRLNESTVLVAEVRTNLGVNKATRSKGLLLYTVDAEIADGGGPIRVYDPRSKGNGRSGTSGASSSAAYDFTKAETIIEAAQFGVSIKVDTVQDENYSITIDWK